MIKLIVTASDELYQALSDKVRAAGHTPQRARDVLQGFEQAAQLGSPASQQAREGAPPSKERAEIVVDMSMRAADTLLETLHSRQSTAHIPLLAVKCDGQTLPLALRRLCVEVLENDGSALAEEQTMSEP
jgi:hypothetical protein